MPRRLALVGLLIGIAVTCGSSYASSEVITVNGFEYAEGSVTHMYYEKFGKPEVTQIPKWLENFVYRELRPQSYDTGPWRGPGNTYDASLTVLGLIPYALDKWADNPEKLRDLKKAVDYLAEEILFILAYEVDNTWYDEPNPDLKKGYRRLPFKHLEGLVRLAGVTTEATEDIPVNGTQEGE